MLGAWFVRIAGDLVVAGFGDVSGDLKQEMSARYSSGEIMQMDTIVRVMTLMNLSGNTFDALLGRIRRRPVAGSRPVDELVVGGSFAAGILPVSLYLSAKRRKSPVRPMRELARLSTQFEGPAAS